MTVWNQPGPGGVGGSPQPRRGLDADGLPSLKVPRVLMIAGAAALLVGIALFVAALRTTPAVLDKNAVAVEENGTAASLILLEDTEYGFYSTDADIACTVSDPAGADLYVYPPARNGGDPPQVLGFRSTDAGSYTVSCTGDSAIRINLAIVSPEGDLSALLAFVSIPFGLVGLVVTVVGTIWLVVRRRRRSRAVVARLFGPQQAGSPAFQSYPPAAQQAHPSAPAVPNTTPGPHGGFQSPAPAAPPPPNPQPAPPSQGSYGLAPQQVIYRPLPPPEGGQGA